MDNFIVSARKYRPITFDSVVGQQHITNTLKNAIQNNQLAQAFLFCGPRGVGKTTCARILAKTINCEQISSQIEPCGTCNSCVSFLMKEQAYRYDERCTVAFFQSAAGNCSLHLFCRAWHTCHSPFDGLFARLTASAMIVPDRARSSYTILR